MNTNFGVEIPCITIDELQQRISERGLAGMQLWPLHICTANEVVKSSRHGWLVRIELMAFHDQANCDALHGPARYPNQEAFLAGLRAGDFS